MFRILSVLATMALICVAPGPEGMAQDQPVRVRGSIDRVEGAVYVVKTRDGGEVKVKLADKGAVVALSRAPLSDIKPGAFIGVSALPQADGSQRALEVHIFPEAMRGTGEGHRSWDLQPQSTMTNGTVEETAASVQGQVLTLKYKDGEKRIAVPADTPIVTYSAGDRSELKPGAGIFIPAATREADGTLLTARINVGRGVTPPM
jgi:hypothetical protein